MTSIEMMQWMMPLVNYKTSSIFKYINMENTRCLELFKQQVNALNYINAKDLSKVASYNTKKYDAILSATITNLITEIDDDKVEYYLVEIRKLWLSHFINLNFIRTVYTALGYKKLERTIDFDEIDLPAYMELLGSNTPNDNKYIDFDKYQVLYWQYLEFVKKHEGAMIYLDQILSDELGVKTNFENIDNLKSGFMSHKCNLGNDFMIDPIKSENFERIIEINEAEAFIKRVLDEVYCHANPKYYNWLIKSILKFPFPEVEVPDVGQESSSFVIPYEGFKSKLYDKIKYIKRKTYPPRKGSKYLAEVFHDSTKNFNDNLVLDIELLEKNM
jgi:hypothetical protein